MDRNRDGSAAVVTRRRALGLIGGSALLLAGCSPSTGPSLPTPGVPTLPGRVPGDTLGTGSVRVALLLPRTAGGEAGQIAAAMRNAAELGLNDFVANDITIVIKDSGGTAETAAAAATQAVAEGVELVIGPVFATEVRAVAPVALSANVPVLAFSSDPSVASPGVYIMGFLVDDQVRQMVNQAAATGRRSMAALISAGGYGDLAEAALRQSAASASVRLVQVERFTPADLAAKAQAIGANAGQIDAVFVPDGGTAAQAVQALSAAGLNPTRTKILGSGQWNEPAVYGSPGLTGAWFPAPEISGFEGFAGRYRTAFGVAPPVIASLGYDAVVLAAGLVRAAGAQRFQRSVLANPEGFLSSVNGLFRFNADGTNDRGLAVYEVSGATPRMIQPAPRSFTGF